MKYPKYSELLKANQENFNLSEPIYDAVVISNVIMGQFKDISEYHLRNSRVNAVVKTGEYDNLLQDAAKYKDADCIFLFYEMGNILDQYAFNDPSSLLSAEELRDKIKGELLFLFSELRNSKLVFLIYFRYCLIVLIP